VSRLAPERGAGAPAGRAAAPPSAPPLRVLMLDRMPGNPYSRGLALALRKLDVDVVMGTPVAFDEDPGVGVYPRHGLRGHRVRKALDVPAAAIAFARLLRRHRPDVVHFQWTGPFDLAYARLARRATSARMVVTVHEPVVTGRTLIRQTKMLELTDGVMVLGKAARARLVGEYPFVGGKEVLACEHGHYDHMITRFDRADARRRLAASEAPVYSFIGALRRRKGVETALDAFAIHRERGGRGTLVLAGTATEPDYYEGLRANERYRDLPIRWHVSDHHVPNELLDLAVSAADQVLLPHHEVSQSGSVLLGMTHGRCVVTTPVGEVKDAAEGHAILVPPRDADALAAALRLAEDDPEECDRIGAEAREHVLRAYDWDDIGRHTVELYGTVVGRAGAAR
jgi:glycosyltransferase involved in cell wall biosynthesis